VKGALKKDDDSNIFEQQARVIEVMLRTYVLCAAGVCGALFLGYCVYFDRKRRSDPDYKKKVIAR